MHIMSKYIIGELEEAIRLFGEYGYDEDVRDTMNINEIVSNLKLNTSSPQEVLTVLKEVEKVYPNAGPFFCIVGCELEEDPNMNTIIHDTFFDPYL